MWTSLLFSSSAFVLATVAITRLARRRRAGADFHTMFRWWPYQATWSAVSVCAVISAVPARSAGDIAALGLAGMAAALVWQARRYCKELTAQRARLALFHRVIRHGATRR